MPATNQIPAEWPVLIVRARPGIHVVDHERRFLIQGREQRPHGWEGQDGEILWFDEVAARSGLTPEAAEGISDRYVDQVATQPFIVRDVDGEPVEMEAQATGEGLFTLSVEGVPVSGALLGKESGDWTLTGEVAPGGFRDPLLVHALERVLDHHVACGPVPARIGTRLQATQRTVLLAERRFKDLQRRRDEAIRAEIASGASVRQLAREVGLTPGRISQIAHARRAG